MIKLDIEKADVIFVNHSGGKDSQAMLAKLIKMGLKDKLVILHADLGEMEWEPMHDWIESISFGLPVHVVKGAIGFFDLCRKYKRLPSGLARFCTNELKTAPCERLMRDYCKKHGFTKAISALGIRADESKKRAEMIQKCIELTGLPIRHKTKLLTVWYPIFDYDLDKVKEEIHQTGQELHWVYGKGYSRLSCVMCPLGRIGEHKMMAKDRPELFQKMVSLEKELGKTIRLKQKNNVKYKRFLTEYCSTEKK